MLQITRSGVVFSGSDADIERMRADFERQDWVRLPAMLDQDLLKMIQQQLAANDFDGKTESIYQQVDVTDGALLILLNSPQLFRILERITGGGHIGCFRGRIYQFVPGARNILEWHSDLNGSRLAAITINL